MKIPEELMKRWQDLRTYGDNKKIAESTGDKINEMAVSRAFTSGECPDDTFQAIADFYKEKEKLVNQYL